MIQEWIGRVFERPEFGLAALPAALVLGFVSAVGSGCNIAVVAVVAGYAGGSQAPRRREALFECGGFLVGSFVSLAILGALVGRLAGLSGTWVGTFGRMFAGFAAAFFGLVALRVVPFNLPRLEFSRSTRFRGLPGSVVFGLAVGAASISCTLGCCAPLLPVVLGLAALKGQPVWGAAILGAFAVGYTAPLGAVMAGVSLGRLSGAATKVAGPIRVVAGIVLIVVGFWLLAGL
ncbi:MAG: hypothetical protein ACYTAN_09600 [Planctomycetota bacterium]